MTSVTAAPAPHHRRHGQPEGTRPLQRVAAAGFTAALFLSPVELRETGDLAETTASEAPALANR